MGKILVERIENLAELEQILTEAASICTVLNSLLAKAKEFELQVKIRQIELTNKDMEVL